MTMTEITTCRAGHPLEGPDADVYLPASGRPVCRPCRRAQQAASRTGAVNPRRRSRTLEPGAWIKVRGRQGTYRVHRIDGDEVTCCGGDKARRQWHTFLVDRVTLTRAPDWARDLPDPFADQ